MAKINFTKSPKSQKVNASYEEKFEALNEAIAAVMEAHGFDEFLLTVKSKNGPYSTAIGTDTYDQALRLFDKSRSTIIEFRDSQTK
ncbi:hypothetical protein [Fibrella aquatilis]|uniref:Uncharacterized protein n=1 Tax=Fibrella aquatilis TaxID=2817059 RepID=A0A939G4M7_9BACT|nr:hypothetical protein [Fibrella aquatilis]MBO0930345.1 hypothetical protein [Fibrella aquatilis]